MTVDHVGNTRRLTLVAWKNQRGASLIVSLLMLIAVLLLGVSAANIALLGEKAARSDRDRQIALQAAEGALMDAELDIDASPDATGSRSALFSMRSTTGFPAASEASCRHRDSIYFGLCRKSSDIRVPTWLALDFLDTTPSAEAVPYGTFTGRTIQADEPESSSRLPRYIIELIPFTSTIAGKDDVTSLYRITAMGFGMRDTTQVMLQSFYRKAAAISPNETVTASLPSGRLSWREVSNWQELRHAALSK